MYGAGAIAELVVCFGPPNPIAPKAEVYLRCEIRTLNLAAARLLRSGRLRVGSIAASREPQRISPAAPSALAITCWMFSGTWAATEAITCWPRGAPRSTAWS